jgi:hypothetical protein
VLTLANLAGRLPSHVDRIMLNDPEADHVPTTKPATAPRSRHWLHGHTHAYRDYTVGRTRIIVNARGYRSQNPNFNPTLTVEV